MVFLAAAAACMACSAAADETTPGVRTNDAAAAVYTHAQVRSFFEEANGRLYVRLKLLPRSKIPFSTQNFLVADRSLVAGVEEGASVRFTAKHLAGENTLTSIQVVEPCRRFQRCD